MKLIIHRGANQIGGSVIELSTEKSRIILDIGQELPNLYERDMNRLPNLPLVKGLYKGEKNNIDAIFISHSHGDHIGLFPYINESIPIFIGKDSSNIYNMTSKFTGKHWLLSPKGFLQNKKPIYVGDFQVTPYLVDHSGYDAYAFVISANGKSVVYTGDIRDHGKKGKLTLAFQNALPRSPDAILMEGTMFGRLDESLKTEDEIQEEAAQIMSLNTKPVLVLQSTTNIDRLVAMYNAAKTINRQFVIDIYAANILSCVSGNVRNILKKVKVIYPAELTNRMFESKEEDLMYRFSSKKITIKELNDNPHYCMLVRSSMMGILKNLEKIEGGTFIYSMWEGYKIRPDIKRVIDFVNERKMEQISLHTSGHGGISTLKKIVNGCKPKMVIPVHTEWKSRFKEYFENVCSVDDGEVINI